MDLMTKLPNSRDYDIPLNGDFNDAIRALQVRKTPFTPTDLYFSNLRSYVDDSDFTMAVTNHREIVSEFCTQLCNYACVSGGLDGVLSMLHCEVNPAMCLTAMVFEDVTPSARRACLNSIPSATYEQGTELELYGFTIKVRPASDLDRGRVGVGPSTTIDSPEYGETQAFVDLNSSSIYGPEYIVLGREDPYATTIGGQTYISYRHCDGPFSKTVTSHYRLYNPWGSFDMTAWVMPLPVIFFKTLRYGSPLFNVMNPLPYASDIELLLSVRPDLDRIAGFLMVSVLNGFNLENITWSRLTKEVGSSPHVNFSSLVTDGKYKRTAYSDTHRGHGIAWEKLYNEMFK